MERGELHEISRVIGGLETSQKALAAQIKDGFDSIQKQMDGMRQSYHDLNNKAQKSMGELAHEFEQKVRSLDTRTAGVEVLLSEVRGRINTLEQVKETSDKINWRWITLVSGGVSTAVIMLVEFLEKIFRK